MKNGAILSAAAILFLAAVVYSRETSAKKINFSGAWVLQNVKNSTSGGGQRGGGGILRPGGYPRGGRTGGGGREGGERRGGGESGNSGILAPPAYTLLIVDHSETALKMTYRSGDTEGQGEFIETFMLDGSESANAGFGNSGQIRTRTTWDNDKLVTLGTQQTSPSGRASSDVVIKQELSLSKDGKTLTVKTTHTANGRSATTDQSYVRQPQTSK